MASVTPLEEHEQRQRAKALADLAYHWDGAYSFTFEDGQYVAARADNGGQVKAATAHELRVAVADDYAARPVPRPAAPRADG